MWNIMECAVQGRGHVKNEIPCQDKTYSFHDNDVHTIVLADGAGSAKLSHYGAAAVVKKIASSLTTYFEEYYAADDGRLVKQCIVEDALEILKSKSEELGCNVKDLASTLLFVAVKDDRYLMGHIGDGVIGYLKDNELKVASHPENGEFANTTIFTTSKDAIATMKLFKGKLGAIRGFVLMSDGTEASMYDKRQKKLADVLKKLLYMTIRTSSKVLQEKLEESFKDVVTKVTTDDCSIAFMMDDRGEFSGYNALKKQEKCDVLKLEWPKASKRRIRRYSDILTFLNKPAGVKKIAAVIHLKFKYTMRHVQILHELGLIEKNGSYYRTLIRL